MAKQLHFNKNMEALKKLQAGVDKLASVVGVTLGPKVRTHDPDQHPCRCPVPHEPNSTHANASSLTCKSTYLTALH
jgi:hypothetical protein